MFVALLVLLALGIALVATGAVVAADHALAHAFPELMLDGCGGG
jgi:hypothetical protein